MATTRTENKRWYGRNWRKLRKMVLSNDPLCRMCAARGRVTPATVVDHITPISQGGHPTDVENLQPLCKRCHDSDKAIIDAGGQIKGCDTSGFPVDPGHAWWHESDGGGGKKLQ